MSLTVGQNSWVTIAEADTYLTERIGAESWFDKADTDDPGLTTKSSLLVTAFQWLMASPQLELSAGLTDSLVKNAQIESALFLMEHYNALNERRAAMSTGVTEFQLSKKMERLDISKLTIPPHIIGLLGAYCIENAFAVLKGHYDS
jgi:hypothetical protein